MMFEHHTVPQQVSALLGRRPVRWGKMSGDYDGRERTLEVFEADAHEQRGLLRLLRPDRAELDAAAGGRLVIVFHTRVESRRLYADWVDTWHRRALAGLVAEWIEEKSDTEPFLEPSDIEPIRLRGAA